MSRFFSLPFAMRRHHVHGREAFPQTVGAYTKEIESTLRQKRAEMDTAWGELEEGWKKLQKRMVDVGVKPATSEERMLKINVGGSSMNIWRSAIEEPAESQGSTLGALLEGVWDERVSRDAEGRMVLDESPSCVRHIVQKLALHKPLSTASGTFQDASSSTVTFDEEPYLYYLYHHVLGLDDKIIYSKCMVLTGESTILRLFERAPLSSVIRQWCPNDPNQAELVFRASRDGFSATSFHERCGDDPRATVTLIRVSAGDDKNASIVGGFSTAPWSPVMETKTTTTRQYSRSYANNVTTTSPGNGPRVSQGAFIFFLKDGTPNSYERGFQPSKWSTTKDPNGQAFVTCGPTYGPRFGLEDLRVRFKAKNVATLSTGGNVNAAAITTLNGKCITELEVFRVCSIDKASLSAKIPSGVEGGTTARAVGAPVDEDGVDVYGATISKMLKEERVTLEYAQTELTQAEKRVSAAVRALATVYGPDVAAGKEDSVVELSVRGAFVTTLRSTLRACPDSALAARFDEDKWPANGQDVDENGRRVIDCSPSSFAKVLDVLRIRKRAGWAKGSAPKQEHGNDSSGENIRVIVKAADRACFNEFVNMHFPGCESFITDLVAP